MDNKTLGLLGLAAALTAFLSHQNFKSGKPRFGSGSSVPEVTASSEDSAPEPVAEAAPVAETAAAPVSDTDSTPSFLKKIPLNCYKDCLKQNDSHLCNDDCFTDWYFKCDADCFKEWLDKPGNEELKSISVTIDTEDTNDLYKRLDILFPRCSFNESNDYCPDKNAPDTGSPAERRNALNELFVTAMLSKNKLNKMAARKHKQKLQCINPLSKEGQDRHVIISNHLKLSQWLSISNQDPSQDENGFRNYRDPSLWAEDGCTSNEDCSLVLSQWSFHPINNERLKDVTYNDPLIKDHTCNPCGRCASTALTGPEQEKIIFYMDRRNVCQKAETRCVYWKRFKKNVCRIKKAPANIQAETAAECERKYMEVNGLQRAVKLIQDAGPAPSHPPPACPPDCGPAGASE